MIKPLVSAGILLAALAQPALAQTTGDLPAGITDSSQLVAVDATVGTTVDPLARVIAAALPPIISKDNSALIGLLMSIKPNGFLSRQFDPAVASRAVFGRSLPNAAPDCKATVTSQKEVDNGLCVLDVGQRDDPTGPYTMLAYSKNIGFGNIAMIKRPAFTVDGAPTLNPVTLSDQQAFSLALKFLDGLGVSSLDVPAVQTGQRLPVRTLAIGLADPTGKQEQRPFRKVVSLQRAFEVPGSLGQFSDANGNKGDLHHVLAPGIAQIAIDDKGIQQLMVTDWSDPVIDPTVDPKFAKTDTELVEEIATHLHSHGVDTVNIIGVLIALRQATPNPDDPNPPLCPACGLLRPALRVTVSQSGLTRAASADGQIAPPGIAFEVDLTHQIGADRAVR
jgi:hypothetical protein